MLKSSLKASSISTFIKDFIGKSKLSRQMYDIIGIKPFAIEPVKINILFIHDISTLESVNV